jgi:nucleoid-associated protein YgaU
MSGVSLPVTRPSGRALIVGNPAGRAEPLGTMQRMGYGCAEADDPYAAMAELCRRPMVYRAVIVSLSSIHREELAFIPGIKRRYPHVEVWLTHTDGRQSALAEAMRLGADGLLSGEGLHRVAVPPGGATAYAPEPPVEVTTQVQRAGPSARADVAAAAAPQAPVAPAAAGDARKASGEEDQNTIGEPVLTADELRALLQEQPGPEK